MQYLYLDNYNLDTHKAFVVQSKPHQQSKINPRQRTSPHYNLHSLNHQLMTILRNANSISTFQRHKQKFNNHSQITFLTTELIVHQINNMC